MKEQITFTTGAAMFVQIRKCQYYKSTVAASQQLFVLCLSSICFASVNGLSGKDGLMDQAEAYGSGKKEKKSSVFGINNCSIMQVATRYSLYESSFIAHNIE